MKKILALLSGGALAVSSLAMWTPATVQAATVKFDECEDSTSHIRSSQIAAVDGQLTVTIDIAFETEKGRFFLYVFDEQLERVGFFQFYDTQFGEGMAAKLESLTESGTYTFDGLTDDKTYYVYCNVSDNHEINGWGEGGNPDDTFWHYAAYLGSGSPSGSPSSSPSDNASSNNPPSDSDLSAGTPSDSDLSAGTPSDSDLSAGTPSDSDLAADIPSDGDQEEGSVSYEDEIANRIEAAPSGSTIVMEKGISALSNSTMKELLKKGDVSLRLEFTYENRDYIIIIPAGAAIDNDIPWYGPLYLAQHFGNRAGTGGASTTAGADAAYEVQSGDCLSKIAAANNMTLRQLLEKNPQIKDPNKITVGQRINR